MTGRAARSESWSCTTFPACCSFTHKEVPCATRRTPWMLQSVAAIWIDGGKEPKSVDTAYLAAASMDLKRLQEVLIGEQRSRLKFGVNNYEHHKSFPIECGERISTGCELSK